MRNKRFQSIIAIVLTVLLAGTAVLSTVLQAGAVSQSDIDALKSQAAELAGKKGDIQSQIDSYEYEQMTILEQKRVLDEQVMLTQEEIDNINAQIEQYELLIAEKETEVQEAQKKEDDQLELYKQRVRSMEENGNISYLAVLFDAADFSDLLARLDFIFEVMSYDKQLYNNYIAAKEETIAAKTSLEEAKAEQESAKEELEGKKEELEGDIEQADAFLAEVKSNLDKYEALYAEIDAAEADLNAEIEQKVAEYQAALEEQRRQEEAEKENNNNSSNNSNEDEKEDEKDNSSSSGSDNSSNSSSGATGNGYFIWPAPASYIITSDYGWRVRDNGTARMHYGIDIGAGYGCNVLAADGGRVITTYYHWSYGNFVIIDHGNGYRTLYAHMSRVYVSPGQKVSQGEVIGLVGNTGDSNGAHLHFEVRSGGGCIDPKQFFSGYTVW